MTHTVKKFLNNRGSALFMVLSTMTALMICCMAMYFSVVSSRSVQYAVFNQQQSYQSASSLSDALIASLYTHNGSFADIADKMLALSEGETISTGANGFATFDAIGAGKEDDEDVGAYMMSITRLNDETLGDKSTVKVYDIVVTASVNGKKEVVHNVIQLTSESSYVASEMKVFTATGYVPNNVFVDGGWVYTNVFFDNEHTLLNAVEGSKALTINGDISCGGSLTLVKYIHNDQKQKYTYAIRGDYANIQTGQYQGITFMAPTASSENEKNLQRSTVMIGGDMSGPRTFSNANVYVLGDAILTSQDSLSGDSLYFINGNVILKQGSVDLSKVYLNGSVICDGGTIRSGCNPKGTWADGATGLENNGLMTKAEMTDELDKRTQTGTYYKWVLDEMEYKKVEIDFTYDGVKTPTHYLGYRGDNKKGYEITDIVENDSTVWTHHTVVIDTGEDPENVVPIKLNAIRDFVGNDGVNESFCWFPKWHVGGGSKIYKNGNGHYAHVLVMGRGTVLFELPDGVTYVDDDKMQLMHYGWYVLNGGQEIAGTGATRAEKISKTEYKVKEGYPTETFANYVHRSCSSSDSCSYSEAKVDKKCPTCSADLYINECSDHGKVGSYYCKACNPEKAGEEGLCENRVHRPAVDATLSANSGYADRMKDSNGKIIYPNVNIFLISCDENADIRLTNPSPETPGSTPSYEFKDNNFFGCIYAPYMTMKAGPGHSGSGVRFMGSLIVSDFIIDDSYAMVACWPDKMPDQLMSETSLSTPMGGASKSWKISLKGR